MEPRDGNTAEVSVESGAGCSRPWDRSWCGPGPRRSGEPAAAQGKPRGRSADRGCALSAASASCPLGSERPITNAQRLLQHKQCLQRVGSISDFVVSFFFPFFFRFFLMPSYKSQAQADPCFKVKYIIVSNRNFKHCLFLWAGVAGSITLTTR